MKQIFMPESLYAELKSVNARAQLLLFHLLSYSNGDYKSCWPSQSTIQSVTGFSKNTLIRATRDLEKLQCLVVNRVTRQDKTGKYNTSVTYHFNFSHWIQIDKMNNKPGTLTEMLNDAKIQSRKDAKRIAHKEVTKATETIRSEVIKMITESGLIYRYTDGKKYHVESGYLSKDSAAQKAAEFAERGIQLKLLKSA